VSKFKKNDKIESTKIKKMQYKILNVIYEVKRLDIDDGGKHLLSCASLDNDFIKVENK